MSICLPRLKLQATEELYRWLGRRDAFSLMAGRCSAADVERIKRIRDNKLYLAVAKDWEEFCEKELHMSKSNANRMIALRDQLGDAYFYITQATRIPLREYRLAIAPHVSVNGLTCNGEVIALLPENTERVAAAVATLRAAAAQPSARNESAVQDEIGALIDTVEQVIAQFRSIRRKQSKPQRRLTTAVGMLWERFAALLQEMS